MPDRGTFALAGYFGFGNAGDEMIADGISGSLPSPVVTLGRDAPRWDPFALTAILRRSKALVYGGGELFQTRTSARSLLYYAALPFLAGACGARFLAYGMGLDPSLPPWARRTAVSVLDWAEHIWFRDEESAILYRGAGGTAPHALAPDPVWARGIPPADPPAAPRRILWIPRDPLEEPFVREVLRRAGGESRALFMHPARDAAFFPSLSAVRWSRPGDLFALTASFDLVVSARYHGLVLAALCGRPAAAWALHGKTATLAAVLGAPLFDPACPEESLAEAWDSRSLQAGRAAALRDSSRRGLDGLRKMADAL